MTRITNTTRQGMVLKRQRLAYGRLNLAICLLVALMGTAQAEEPVQSQDSLLKSARTFLENELATMTQEPAKIALGRIDPRLRLKACDGALQPFLPEGTKLQGRLNVGIRCPEAWTVYLSADIKVFSEVMVAARPLSRGDTIRAGDIIPQRMEISNLNSGYYLSDKDVAGKILKRSIPAGRPLTPNVLRAPLLVRRGDAVTIIASGAGLQVRMKGKALQDAALGEHVSVQNIHSKRVVEGTAIETGQVQVLM